MTYPFKHRVFKAVAVLAATLGVSAAHAEFPDKPLKMIVPFTPGGVTDLVGRSIAAHMSQTLGQQVIVDNRPGANTVIGVDALKRDPADGYSLLIVAGNTIVLNPLLSKKLSYDPKVDLSLLQICVDTPMIMVVPASQTAKNPAEFKKYALANDGKVSFASTGVGSTPQLAAEFFNKMAGLSLIHVPYKGSVPAIADMVGGNVQVMFDAPTTSLPQIRSGKLKALGVTTKERMPLLPDVPSIGDSFPGYQASLWFGVAIRKGVPEPIAAKLRQAVDSAMSDATFRQTFEAQGSFVRKPMSAAEIEKFLEREQAQWSSVVQANHITVD